MMLAVCYDIGNNKRRRAMVKLLSSYGYRVQESIFHCKLLHKKDEQVLVNSIKKIIDKNKDICHIYSLGNQEYLVFGNELDGDVGDIVIC